VTSAKAAIQLVLAGRKQGDPLHAWGGYKGMSNTYNVSSRAQAEAAAAVARIGTQATGAGGNTFLRSLRSNIYQGQGNSAAGTQLVSWLKAQIGKPYVFGSGINPNGSGFDCSSLIASGYDMLGIEIPAYTFTMKNYGQQVTDYSQLQVGDMLYVHGSQGDFGHVGVYVGGGQVIDAPHTGAFVRETPLSDWLPRIQAVNRIMDASGNVIVGSGLVPKTKPGIGQVTASQARMIQDPNSTVPDQSVFGITDLMRGVASGRPTFGMVRFDVSGNEGSTIGAADPATTSGLPPSSSSVLAPEEPFILPGKGGEVEPV
jgi:cell wall-associated NlpC family hydrolase